MYFNERIFKAQYISPERWGQTQEKIAQYNFDQNVEVVKVVNAVRDICRAVKKMSPQHQQDAFVSCLGVMAQELSWCAYE